MSRFYLTTAIDYVNSRPHLGTAYEKIVADVIARYKRLRGFDTRFVMGNDEHSQNVFTGASRKDCRRWRTAIGWKSSSRARLAVSRRVVRRFHPHDRAATQSRRDRLAQRIHDAGDIYEGSYEGWYCEGCEAFKQEKDLVDGKCPLHPTTPRMDQREELLLQAVEVSAAAD